MQSASAPRTPGSPTRSSCHERDREREREREQERNRERERGRQSRTSPEENREDREERGAIARQTLGPPAAITGNQGLPLSLSLEDRELWTRFQCITNEMIVTKNGRYIHRHTHVLIGRLISIIDLEGEISFDTRVIEFVISLSCSYAAII